MLTRCGCFLSQGDKAHYNRLACVHLMLSLRKLAASLKNESFEKVCLVQKNEAIVLLAAAEYERRKVFSSYISEEFFDPFSKQWFWLFPI